MYCSHCGSSMASDLNYCKNCGARNEHSPLAEGGNPARPFAFVALLIGGFGLFGFYGVLRELLHSSLDPAAIVILMVVYATALVAMFSIPIGAGRKYGELRSKRMGRSDTYQPAASFRAVNTAQLEDPREVPASVTEHTTRTLDQVPVVKN